MSLLELYFWSITRRGVLSVGELEELRDAADEWGFEGVARDAQRKIDIRMRNYEALGPVIDVEPRKPAYGRYKGME